MKHCILVACVALVSVGIARADDRPPNIVFIIADDLGWADLGCYGNKFNKTPNLDRLAAEGARFTQAYAAAPVGSPTRAAILTGKYAARLNLTDWLPGRPTTSDQRLRRPDTATELPATESTLPALLKKAGYVTGHIGKWHLGGDGAGPLDRGFDTNVAGDHADRPLSYFAPFADQAKRFMPGLATATDGEYLTDRLTAEAEKFIATNRDKPFFLYLAHFAPHTPMAAKADIVAKYKAGQGNAHYAAMLESLDDGVGRVLKKLDDLKLSERTIVLFTSDNGGLCTADGPNTPATSNAPLREGKGFLYEGGLRVPLIVKWPGVTRAGQTVATMVHSIDFFPTIMTAAGLKPAGGSDGQKLAPLLRGEAFARDALYWHFPHDSAQGGKPGGAIRAGDYKLVEFFENGRRELFDVKTDPGENRNLIEEKPMIAATLAVQLAAWRKAIGAKMPTLNRDYVPNPQSKDGTISMHSRTATVHGVMLRYEPLPHKDTLGYWVRAEDWAEFEFTVARPGTFTVEMLQGCGKGNGGSDVTVAIGDQTLSFVVEDTGHFQNFKARDIGTVEIDKPGRYTLTVKPKKKAAAAVMDLRSVTLKPVAKGKSK